MVFEFQLTAARRRLPKKRPQIGRKNRFQLTAARRRLRATGLHICARRSFNSQPPEGGCRLLCAHQVSKTGVSTHSRPKAAAVTPT